MSYILDALRRADTERDRGSVPTLHAQPLTPETVDPGRATGGFPLLWTGLGVAALAMLGLLGWRALERDGAPDAGVAVTPPVPVSSPVSESASGSASAPAASAPAATATPSSPSAAPGSAPSAATLEPIPAPKKVDKPVPRAEALPVAQVPPAESRIYAPTELPADVQRALPRLVVGGASYSDNPASRMLIINGQVFHEGDALAPDLSLEQIKLKTAVLRFKGWRYGISY